MDQREAVSGKNDFVETFIARQTDRSTKRQRFCILRGS
jgi:hypothetical protein